MIIQHMSNSMRKQMDVSIDIEYIKIAIKFNIYLRQNS